MYACLCMFTHLICDLGNDVTKPLPADKRAVAIDAVLKNPEYLSSQYWHSILGDPQLWGMFDSLFSCRFTI